MKHTGPGMIERAIHAWTRRDGDAPSDRAIPYLLVAHYQDTGVWLRVEGVEEAKALWARVEPPPQVVPDSENAWTLPGRNVVRTSNDEIHRLLNSEPEILTLRELALRCPDAVLMMTVGRPK